MSKPQYIAIIYHKSDNDGICSLAIVDFFLRRNQPNVELTRFPVEYGDGDDLTPQSLAVYDGVFMVDFSIPALLDDKEFAENKLVWIDHHKSALDRWSGTKVLGIRDVDRAACELCWDYFNDQRMDLHDPYMDIPPLVHHLGRWDVWDHRDPDTEFVQLGFNKLNFQKKLTCLRTHFQDSLQDEHPSMVSMLVDVRRAGQVIKSYLNATGYERMKSLVHTLVWNSNYWLVANTSKGSKQFEPFINDDLSIEGLMAWQVDKKGEVTVSLYREDSMSKPSTPLLEIAKAHGGGGHPNACGFRCTLAEMATILEGE